METHDRKLVAKARADLKKVLAVDPRWAEAKQALEDLDAIETR